LRIGIVSDTHVWSYRKLPPEVAQVFAGVDLIIHAGDVLGLGVLRGLEGIAPVVFVEGNCDHFDGPERAVVHAGQHAIGVVHRPPRLFQVETLADYFGEPVGAVVHGHTHRSHITQMGDVLCMNPGSPTTPRDGARSVILLEATDELRPRIHVLGPETGGD
jgi:putative phosphoesterase